MEERTEKLEGAMEQIDERMNRLELEIAELRSSHKTEADEIRRMILEETAKVRAELKAEIDKLGDRLNKLESRLDGLSEQLNGLQMLIVSNFKWLIGVILGMLIPMWVTIILAMLFRG